MNKHLIDQFGCEWSLDPSITYLNHGSFGARPLEVVQAQESLREALETSPVDFLDRQGEGYMTQSRVVLSKFLHADVDGLGFVDNATTGVSIAIQSCNLQKGDEILTTNHVYNGVRQLLRKIANHTSATYREMHLSIPIESDDQILESLESAITLQTKVLVIDHVTSTTAIILPIKKIIELCRTKDILIIVDGAHAAGMLDLSIDSLDADWYVGNLHKWVCAPLGAGYIWTHPKHRAQTHPLTISHFLNQGYLKEFDWQGTRDYTAWFAVPEVIKWGNRIGWDLIRHHNNELAVWSLSELVKAFGTTPLTPISGEMVGSMVTLQLPNYAPRGEEGCTAFRDYLYSEHGIEVPIFLFEGNAMIRFSCQIYVTKEMVKRAISVLKSELRR